MINPLLRKVAWRIHPPRLQPWSHKQRLSVRTLGGEVIRGRWGKSLSDGSLSRTFSAEGVAVLLFCTTLGPSHAVW